MGERAKRTLLRSNRPARVVGIQQPRAAAHRVGSYTHGTATATDDYSGVAPNPAHIACPPASAERRSNCAISSGGNGRL